MKSCPHLKDEQGLVVTIGGEQYQLCKACVNNAIRWRRIYSPGQMIDLLMRKWSALVE